MRDEARTEKRERTRKNGKRKGDNGRNRGRRRERRGRKRGRKWKGRKEGESMSSIKGERSEKESIGHRGLNLKFGKMNTSFKGVENGTKSMMNNMRTKKRELM